MIIVFVLPDKMKWIAAVMLLSCGWAAANQQQDGGGIRKLLRDLVPEQGRDDARLTHLARSVNKIIDEYVGTRPVVFFANEVRRSELGQRILAGMAHPRLLVSPADLRLANGLIVYLERWNGQSTDYDAVLGRLPSSDHSRHMVLWGGGDGGGSGSGDRVDLHRIQVTFEAFWQYQLVDVAVFVPMFTGSLRVYSFNPYTGSRCNKAGPPIMINVWSGSANAFLNPARVFGLDDKLKDLHKYVV